MSLTDDAFGTVQAIERLLGYFDHCARTHLRISPQSVGAATIGHFGFFRREFADSLWPIALAWLQRGQLPAHYPGVLVAPAGRTRL